MTKDDCITVREVKAESIPKSVGIWNKIWKIIVSLQNKWKLEVGNNISRTEQYSHMNSVAVRFTSLKRPF